VRAGDTVVHAPSGARFVVACVVGPYAYPVGRAPVVGAWAHECRAVATGDDARCEATLERFAGPADDGDPRRAACARQLADWRAYRGGAADNDAMALPTCVRCGIAAIRCPCDAFAPKRGGSLDWPAPLPAVAQDPAHVARLRDDGWKRGES
jgi:hypothetical protein